jgi:hypothetical protein
VARCAKRKRVDRCFPLTPRLYPRTFHPSPSARKAAQPRSVTSRGLTPIGKGGAGEKGLQIRERMPTKREERRERSEAQKLERARQMRQRVVRSRVMVVVGILAVIAVAVVLRRQRATPNDGRVWSAAHGHWHDRNGVEIR